MHPRSTPRTRVLAVLLTAAALVLAPALAGSAVADTVLSPTIPVGNNTKRIAFTPDGTAAYVTNFTTGLDEIDLTVSPPTTTTIPIGVSLPVAVAVTPDGATVLVGSSNSNNLAILDRSTGVVTNVVTDVVPVAIAISPDGTTAYLAGSSASVVGAPLVQLIDIATATPGAQLPLAPNSGPTAIDISADGSTLYVASQNTSALSVMDVPSGARADYLLTFYPNDLELSADGATVYISGGNAVTAFDAATGAVGASVTKFGAFGMAAAPAGDKLFVAAIDGALLSIALPGLAVTSYTVSNGLVDVAINGAGSLALTGFANSGEVAMISVDSPPVLAASLPAGVLGTAYSASVARVGTPPVAYSLSAGILPSGLALDPSTGAITGTPTATGTFAFAITGTNGVSSASVSYSVVISPVAVPPGTPQLAATGTTVPWPLVGVGVLLLLIGAIFLILRARGRRA